MKQSVLDALHGIQLWGIVRSDTGGRCGRNDEFLAAFKRLEEEVSNVEEENEKLRDLVRDMFMTFCVVRDTPMTDHDELEHSVRFWNRLNELGIEVERWTSTRSRFRTGGGGRRRS